ncbi:MAG: acyltransferase domain-containing protein [Eubacterium sp.]|nr:acyltransferase domain-containing protein [Eubacterium sp.]
MYLEFIEKLNLDDNLKLKVTDLINQNEVSILRLSRKFAKKRTGCLKFKSDLTRLACAVKASEITYKKYKNKGIDDKIFFDTMDDIRIWCENNNNEGLKEYNWIKNHLGFELFKIGRLQFQLFKCNNPTLNYKKLPVKYRSKAVYVHIPQGEKLDYDTCLSSIRSAKAFLKKYFPKYKYEYFFCESWLLYEKNKEFMNKNSNILQFQSLFNIAYSVEEDGQAIERIFGKKEKDVSCYKQETSLQKSAKEYMQNGGKLGIGIGYIKASDIH